jgi:ATP-dependent DNA helicase RecG
VFCPDAKIAIKQIRVVNENGVDDFVLLFRVWYNEQIVVRTTAGKVFVRKGDSLCELRPEEIRELQADKGEISFEQQDCGLQFASDFDEQSLNEFVGKVRKARKISDSSRSNEVLVLRHLGKLNSGTFTPNIACALLFAKDPQSIIPGCKVHFQKFDGETEGTGDRYNVVREEMLEGTVPDLILQTEAVLDSQLRTFAPFDAKGKFFPVPEYPKEAWYEVIVNACVHRSYGNGMKNMPIFVKMFDDRLIVESPGPFPPFVTPETIYDVHHPRNPQLMDAMFYLDFVRCAHEGTRRIRDSMANAGLPAAEFVQSQIGYSIVRVTLRNIIKQRRAWIDRDVSHLISEAIAADLSENEKRALNWAAVHQSITISDADKLLDISWQGARKILLGLARKRIFQYIRFRPFTKDLRDPKAFFRLRSNASLPDGAFEQGNVDDVEGPDD